MSSAIPKCPCGGAPMQESTHDGLRFVACYDCDLHTRPRPSRQTSEAEILSDWQRLVAEPASELEIEPCPWCGGSGQLSIEDDGGAGAGFWVEGCCSDGPARLTAEEAVEAWNRVAIDARDAPGLRILATGLRARIAALEQRLAAALEGRTAEARLGAA